MIIGAIFALTYLVLAFGRLPFLRVERTAAAVLLITRWVKPDKIYGQIDRSLLMLFVGLFVVIGGVERAGLDRLFFTWLEPVGVTTRGGLAITAAVLSNAISNVPA